MKTSFIACICSAALAVAVFGQNTPPAPVTSPAPAASISPAASVSPSGDIADKIHQRIEKKLKGHHGIVIDGDNSDEDARAWDLGEKMAVPIVAIVFMSIFGAPVLIVAVILYFGFSKSRMQHRTIRMLAEKGQPIPPALLAPPAPAVRQRSDMRRGVVLTMVGIGLVLFLGAVNEWEGGAWSIGLIPFLIGAGYLIVWRLEGKNKDNPPPLP